MNGKFIVFEGIDGCGKDTQINILKKKLIERGYETVTGNEPTDGPVGKIIRDFLNGERNCDPKIFGPLYAADRLDHLSNGIPLEGIECTLANGIHYIESRWVLSSMAYNAVDCDKECIRLMNKTCSDKLHADLTIYLDISPEESIRRLKNGHNGIDEPDIFEKDLDRLKKTYANYENLIREFRIQENIKIINGELSIEEISEEILKEVLKILE